MTAQLSSTTSRNADNEADYGCDRSSSPIPLTEYNLDRLSLQENGRKESGSVTSLAQKRRKYSADLYQYTKGMWNVVREDIDRRKGSTDSAETEDSSSQSQLH